ncbi:hypothetical protein HY346_00865 [Candidatus Microgenomates bacterium]|nr:hypothetical protein [Candidatus Microgenomates bacterium]
MRKILLALALFYLIPVYAAPSDKIIDLDAAVITLSQDACALDGKPDPTSALKNGNVRFKPGVNLSPRKLCWVEQDGFIWTIDEALAIGQFSVKLVKPAPAGS